MSELTKRLAALREQQDDPFDRREELFDRAMPILSHFFHVVRCPNHGKAERQEAYDLACKTWDLLEAAHVAAVESIDAEFGEQIEHGERDGDDATDVTPAVTHPGVNRLQ